MKNSQHAGATEPITEEPRSATLPLPIGALPNNVSISLHAFLGKLVIVELHLSPYPYERLYGTASEKDVFILFSQRTQLRSLRVVRIYALIFVSFDPVALAR